MTVLLLEYQSTLLAIDLAQVGRLVLREGISPVDDRLLFPSQGGTTYVQLKNDRLLPASRVIGIHECPTVQSVSPFLAGALKTNPFAGFFHCKDKVFGLLSPDFLAKKE